MQFTIKIEKDNCLPFLDVMTYRRPDDSNGHFVYRKPSHSDKYLHYTSYHHHSQSIAVIDSLANRAFMISDDDHLQEDHITDVLLKNGYPIKKIKSRIQIMKSRCIKRLQNNEEKTPSEEKKTGLFYFTLAMLQTEFQILYVRRKLKINIGYTTGTRISTFICKYKDKQLIDFQKCGIYSLGCNSCDQKYIGETERNFNTRIQEHLADALHGRVKKSAAANHIAIFPGHLPDINSPQLIEREPRRFARKFKESLMIRKCTSKMNIQDGI